MVFLFHLGISLALIVLQTTVLPTLVPGVRFYDLLIVLVIYLGLRRPLKESLPVTAGLGLIMDSLSGSPFGLYLSCYLWLLMGLTWMIQYLHARNVSLLLVVISVGVLFENLLFFATIFLPDPRAELLGAAIKILFSQVAWAALTGPVLLLVLSLAQTRWDAFEARVAASRSA